MPCREADLLEALRSVLAEIPASEYPLRPERDLLERIDEDEEAIRHNRDPYGDSGAVY